MCVSVYVPCELEGKKNSHGGKSPPPPEETVLFFVFFSYSEKAFALNIDGLGGNFEAGSAAFLGSRTHQRSPALLILVYIFFYFFAVYFLSSLYR